MASDQVQVPAQSRATSMGQNHSNATKEDDQTRRKPSKEVAANDDEVSSDEDTDDEEESEVDTEDEDPEAWTSSDDEPAEKEATTSRKRSHEASDTQAEHKKRKLNGTTAQDVAVANDDSSDNPMSLTSWPELGKEVPDGLRRRRAELTKYQRDLSQYVNQIQAGAVPYTLVKSLLERLESYIDYTHHMFVGNVAAREANLRHVETLVSTAMQEAVNYTEQVMQTVLKREAKDCTRMRERFTRAYHAGPNVQP